MIVYENIPEKVSEYRGTIEVYEDEILQVDLDAKSVVARHPEWRWRCKSRNGQILAQGEGYRRRSGALNAIDTQYAARLKVGGINYDVVPRGQERQMLVCPWRVVILDRHGDIDKIGALY
ncbi:YegP family protein [Gordonia westfalica]|uniref:DUF1508 domain-containing protein n=1 Tax=Gordonia westfalica TaxID=158898 RepID=A0A1H2DNS5_9ACTN|nr:YegP family protein [Gordonia westfalica]SDT83687.1 protein of unknown function [Gordonia westfalica]SDT83733.1 protein of unknown function [Gordonia westfalica]SDT84524.1 protein of unknown function [Gordonia westfalica]SDT84545.1 protein of unknown function [Gordonia westfalica]SDT85294.1 protein of unknown function [Gordonia westfalica]